jgi:ATP-dependent DNA helicase RecQ
MAAGVAAELIRDSSIQCGGIVGVQSLRRPVLLRTLVDGMATALNLPVLGWLPADEHTDHGGRSNNARRVATLHDCFAVSAELEAACRGSSDAVLLIDDFIDSGWTMTFAGRALRRAGAAHVVPFALATTGRRD